MQKPGEYRTDQSGYFGYLLADLYDCGAKDLVGADRNYSPRDGPMGILSDLTCVGGINGKGRRDIIGIGDAKNDHALLEVCEVRVAVANAIDSLKTHADVILSDPKGQGVARFLRGAVLLGEIRVESKRWQVELGTFTDGTPAMIPASQINVLITGETGSGGRYLPA